MKSRPKLILAFAAPLLLFAVILYGCAAKEKPTNKSSELEVLPISPGKEKSGMFVGSLACKSCHIKQFQDHMHSRHFSTLRTVMSLPAALIPPDGPIPNTDYVVSTVNGMKQMSRRGRPDETRKMEFAFGSGKSGMTYVHFESEKRLWELRMSYIPSLKTWYTTPGQEGQPNNQTGLMHPTKVAQHCAGCHTNDLPTDTSRPMPSRLGVGCESCHGPSSQHVAAAAIKGNLDLKIEKMGQWPADKLNKMCGKCHRTQVDASLLTREVTSTARFAPYGLMTSPCYRKSGQAISCSACHNPHRDSEVGSKAYEPACLSCHGGTPLPKAKLPAGVPVNICPVNPKTGCIPCHMKKHIAFPGSELPVKMVDHYIWAYRKPVPLTTTSAQVPSGKR